MKKIYISILSILVVVSVLLCGCQSNKPKELETIIYGHTASSTIFHSSEKEYEKFEYREYKENISKNTITIDVLGTKYTGIYATTAKMPRSDMEVYIYDLQGTERGKVLINTKTNAIVEYCAVPYDENLITESDCVDFIKQMLGNSRDLKEYDYKCATHYYSFEPNEMRSQVVDGFRDCGENERIGTYSFYYTKSENGVKLQDRISAEFNIERKTFLLEIYEYDYESTRFSPILDRMDEVEENIEKHLQDNLKAGYTLVSIEHGSKKVFVQDDVPYVMIYSSVTYATESGGEYSTVIQTITG